MGKGKGREDKQKVDLLVFRHQAEIKGGKSKHLLRW
jgi:hypothetical protein